MIPLPSLQSVNGVVKLVYYKTREILASRKENQKDLVPDSVRERIAFDAFKVATSETRAPVEHTTIEEIFSKVQIGYYLRKGIKNPEDAEVPQ